MKTPRPTILFLAFILMFTAVSISGPDLSQDATASDHFPWWEPGIIQPGARISGAGTVGFLFVSMNDTYPDGEPLLFATAAGHGSNREVGDIIQLFNGPEIGPVVAKSKEPGHDDWALIEIFDESREYVDFSVRHWSGPTGMPDPDEIALDDEVCHYGYGQGFDNSQFTRPRCYRLTSAFYGSTGVVSLISYFPYLPGPGDSGSPIIHYETGQALGMLLASNPVTQEGRAIDICSLKDRFADHGFYVELATAPYDPPMAQPTAPAPFAHSLFHDTLGPSPAWWDWWKWETECMTGQTP